MYHRTLKNAKAFRALIPYVFAFFLLWISIAVIPLVPPIPGTGLDGSWAYALSMSHAQGFIFGRDVVFTFGPLGYLYYPVPELSEPLPTFALGWSLYAIFIFGIATIWRLLGNNWITAACWSVLSAGILLLDVPFERMQMSFLTLALGGIAWLVTRPGIPFLYLAFVGAFAGLFPLFKINEGVAAAAVFYAILGGLFLRSRKDSRSVRGILILGLVPPLAFVLGYAFAEHEVSSIWSYIVNSIRVASGYSEAMAVAGPMSQAILAVLTILALFVVAPLFMSSRRDLVIGLPPAALTALFAFKSGMVREDDGHASLLQIKFAVAGIFLFVCAKTARDRILVLSCILASFCGGALLFAKTSPVQWGIATGRASLRNQSMHGALWPGVYQNLSYNWHFSSTWKQFGGYQQQQLQTLRLDPGVAGIVGDGTVDDVPYNLEIVPANGWRWKSRPVIQSYSAYTPALDELNARHLKSPDSADHIIMQWEDIDGRQPLLDDAASWRALFDRYDIALKRPEFLVLKRRNSSRYLEPRAAGSTVGAWQTDIAVPQLGEGEFAMMRAELSKSLWGEACGLLFRNTPVYLTATFSSGRRASWRVTRANLIDGAFIGYLPQDLHETLPYFGQFGPGQPDEVTAIRFETPRRMEYSPAIRISWFAVALRPAEMERQEHPRIVLSEIWKPGQPVTPDGAEIQKAPGELIVRPSQFDPRLTFNFAQGLARFKTLVITARLSSAGSVNVFFGQQKDGRGVEGYVPVINRWVDIYVDMAANSFWSREAGTALRFDPPDESVGSTIEIAGIRASDGSMETGERMSFYPLDDPHLASLPIPARIAAAPLQRLETHTGCSVDSVNDQPPLVGPVTAQSNRLITVSGWAADARAHKPASAVWIDVEGTLFSTSYGLSRPDVADFLKEPAYQKSGFTSRIYMGPGTHRASLRIVNAARTGYYVERPFVLNVK